MYVFNKKYNFMDLYFVILGILFFIFGLLQIILFFKLWAMTNNVKKIAQGNDSPHVDWQLRACVLTGDMDRAEKLIIEDFVEKVRLHVVQHGPSESIGPIKNACRARFKAIGKQMPEAIEKLQNGANIIQLIP
ncbi:MAG TPA: hypothetical protein DGC56_01165 [Alistipes putredinis]|nr:hypothetical protein [Alistipes putredinis]